DQFVVLGSEERFDLAQLLALLTRDPARFSGSALLRPIVQDTLFPTAAYVGGPAEVSYFAQIAPLYRSFGLQPPLVAPRASFRLITKEMGRLLDKISLGAAEAELPPSRLAARLLGPRANMPSRSWLGEIESRLGVLEAEEPM